MEGCLDFGIKSLLFFATKGCLAFGIFIVVFVIWATVLAKVNFNLGGRYFRKLCSGMSGSYEVKDVKDLAYVHQFHTEVEGRKVNISFGVPVKTIRVAFEERLDRSSDTRSDVRRQLEIVDLLEIRIPIKQKFWLRIHRDLLADEDTVEVKVGIDWIDTEYVIQTNQLDAADDFLRKFTVQELLSRFPSRFDKLEIIHGEICLLLYHPQSWGLERPLFDEMLQQLLSFAQLYEDHQRIDVQIEITTSFSRCPYCRTSFDKGSSENVVQCLDCSTRLHEACWNENLQCTTWGCKSTATPENVQLE